MRQALAAASSTGPSGPEDSSVPLSRVPQTPVPWPRSRVADDVIVADITSGHPEGADMATGIHHPGRRLHGGVAAMLAEPTSAHDRSRSPSRSDATGIGVAGGGTDARSGAAASVGGRPVMAESRVSYSDAEAGLKFLENDLIDMRGSRGKLILEKTKIEGALTNPTRETLVKATAQEKLLSHFVEGHIQEGQRLTCRYSQTTSWTRNVPPF